MTKDLGVWTAEDCALVLIDYQTASDVIYWYFSEVPGLTDAVGVAEAEKRAASAHGLH
jgi:hypothetical protein